MVGPPPESWAVDPRRASALEVRPGLWSLRLPLPWSAIPHVNAYALEREDGGITLVDCGGGGDPSAWEALRCALAAAGLAVRDVRALVLTHYHSDHAGLAGLLADATGCEILGHPDHAHFTDATGHPGRVAAARERRARDEGVHDSLLGDCRTVREELEGVTGAAFPDRPLRGGERLAARGGSWEVIATPGHAPSHLSLLLGEDGVLIAGDLLSPVFGPYMDYGYSADPVAEYLASLERVAARGPLTLALPGHGRPIEDPAGAIELWREGFAERLEAVLAAVRKAPAGGYQVTQRVFGEQASGFRAVWQVVEVICYLRHLRLTGSVDRDRGPDGQLRYTATEAC